MSHRPDDPETAPLLKTPMDWTKASALVAIGSFVISLFTLYMLFDSSRTTTLIASQALETARQANQISMGLAREPAILEFDYLSNKNLEFDFTTSEPLQTELKTILTVKNVGQMAIDAVAFEFIGIVGLTLQTSNPNSQFKFLPAFSTRLDLYATLQPYTSAHIDLRKYILQYLTKLLPQLPDRNSTYHTVVNVVLSPKATNETTPSPAGLGATKKDRVLIAIKFSPKIMESAEAKALMQSTEVVHRVYGN